MAEFLGLPGLVVSNLRADECGTIRAEFPAGYSSLVAVFIHSQHMFSRELGLPCKDVLTRDLRHRQDL